MGLYWKWDVNFYAWQRQWNYTNGLKHRIKSPLIPLLKRGTNKNTNK